MDIQQIIIWFGVIILIIILLVTPANNSLNENFIGNFDNNNCGYKGRVSCNINGGNCGYCIKYDGQSECVAGNALGPFFRSDCDEWEYMSPFVNHLFPSIVPYYPYGRPSIFWNRRRYYR